MISLWLFGFRFQAENYWSSHGRGIGCTRFYIFMGVKTVKRKISIDCRFLNEIIFHKTYSNRDSRNLAFPRIYHRLSSVTVNHGIINTVKVTWLVENNPQLMTKGTQKKEWLFKSLIHFYPAAKVAPSVCSTHDFNVAMIRRAFESVSVRAVIVLFSYSFRSFLDIEKSGHFPEKIASFLNENKKNTKKTLDFQRNSEINKRGTN